MRLVLLLALLLPKAADGARLSVFFSGEVRGNLKPCG